jgi:hypothetical protein
MVVKKRPTGVIILAVLVVLVGILDLILGALVFTVSALVAWMLTGVLGTIVGAMGGLIGTILALLGILSFAIAYGLLKGMRWAWTLSLVFWAIDVILGLLALPNGILRIVVGGILLLYLTRPHIRAFFE